MVFRRDRGGFAKIITLFCFAVAASIGLPLSVNAATIQAAWEALQRGGHIAVVRRAASKTADQPPTSGCSEDVVLTDDGFAEANRISQAFRARNIAVDAIYASQWCTAAVTADALRLGPVKPFPALNSFSGQTDRKDEQMAALKPWVGNATPQGNMVLVTHRDVATALTDLVPNEGEIIVVKPLGGGEIEIVGRITAWDGQ